VPGDARVAWAEFVDEVVAIPDVLRDTWFIALRGDALLDAAGECVILE
jgi:hypothetical protein